MEISRGINNICTKLGFDNYPTTEPINPAIMNQVRKLGIDNFSRQILVGFFMLHLSDSLSPQDSILQVAIVGGDLQEPELAALTLMGYTFEATVLGLDNESEFYFDLNLKESVAPKKFNLVLCSQVLEHVWNVQHSFLNLRNLLDDGGLLWLSCPSSNRFHGSPDYFSAGYSEHFLRNQISALNLGVLAAGAFGSHRN